VLRTQTDAPAVIVREVSMPDGGRIDVLAIDADGEISICECKRASNPGSRREVVGQVLEYAGWLN
jgi:RecB family endonuclease NucS